MLFIRFITILYIIIKNIILYFFNKKKYNIDNCIIDLCNYSPLFGKFGQIISNHLDIFPILSNKLIYLCDKYIHKNFKYKYDKIKNLTYIGSGTTSIVFLGIKDNKKYAIKMINKDKIKEWRDDIIILNFIINIIYIFSNSCIKMNIKNRWNEIKELFLSQLDINNEIKAINNFNKIYENNNNIIIPKIYEDLSDINNNILVMDYIEGNNILYADINKLGEFLITNILLTGYIHGDLHLGNIKYDLTSQKIILYDFGITKKIKIKNKNLAYKLFINLVYKNWCDLFIFLAENFYTTKINKYEFINFVIFIYDPIVLFRNNKNSKMIHFIDIMFDYAIKHNKIFNNNIPEIELAIMSLEGIISQVYNDNIWNISFRICENMNLYKNNNEIDNFHDILDWSIYYVYN